MTDQDARLRELPTAELVKKLAEDTSHLVRDEVRLARAELTQSGRQAAGIGGMWGAAGVAGLLMLGTLTACIVLMLATAMPDWLAALIVTLIWGAVAAVLASRAKARTREAKLAPERTIDEVKEDMAWLKNPTGSERR